MMLFRYLSVAALILILTLAVWIAWLNRTSDAVRINAWSAFIIGAAGVLVTLLVSLKTEEVIVQPFPAAFVFDRHTRQPFSCPGLSEATQYADPGFANLVVPAFALVAELSKDRSALLANDDDELSNGLYLDILLRHVVDLLTRTFAKSWDAEVVRFDLPRGMETRYGEHTPHREGGEINRQTLVNLFPESAVLAFIPPVDAADVFNVLNVPPNTTVVRLPGGKDTRALELRNPFATVTISLRWHSSQRGIGRLQDVCNLPMSGNYDNWLSATYSISVRARFQRLRSGHPDMPLYRRWVDTMFSEIRGFDAERRWQAVKEAFQLYATYRRQALEEMMRETIEKSRKE